MSLTTTTKTLITFGSPVLLLVSSCAKMPSHKAEKRNTSLSIPNHYNSASIPVPELAKSLSTLFPSSQLRHYMNTALRHNPNLRLSAARLEEAGFNTRKAQSGLLPNLTGNASLSRSHSLRETSRYNASLDSQWEVDVWKRIRSGVSASASNQAAASADFAAAKQSIAAQTAQAYFNLIAAQKLLDLTHSRLASFQKTFALVDRRFTAGTGNLGDLDLARTDVENTRAQLAQRKDARDQASRRLAALTGSYPNANRQAYNWPSLKRSVAAGTPSSLLLKRPDIHAAYLRIRAADSRVNVAYADLFPRFNLTASLGQSSNTLKNLATSQFNAWSILGGLSAPLIDNGNRKAELGAANARAKQALASYQATVLSALAEVENALGSERYLLQQLNASTAALKAARSAEDRIRQSYEKGLVEILSLLDAQRRRFAAEEALINVTNLRYQNRVALALALGKAL